MKNPRTWDLLWNAGENFMLSVQPPHEIAFFTFGHGFLFHGVVTAEQKENVSDFLKELKEHSQNRDGGTALYDAIISAVRSAPKTGWSADTIYVISDGEDHLSYSTSTDVEREVVEAGIRLFFLFLPSWDDSPKHRKRVLIQRRQLRRIARDSGGAAFEFSRHPSNGDPFVSIRPLYDAIITQSYIVEVQLPQGVDEPRRWKLDVVDNKGKKLKGVKLVYPRLLVPQAKAEEPD
jgi:hypothetical protein